MSVRRSLYRVYWALRAKIAPRLRYSQDDYEEALARHVRPDRDWLEIGCGHSVLPAWRAGQEREIVARCRSVVGVDYDMGSLKGHATISKKLRADVARLPFESGSFDLATANMVVEHLDRPLEQFREIHRVLRRGGVFLFHTPNALGYVTIFGRLLPDRWKQRLALLLEDRGAADVFRTHYRANTEREIRGLAARSGFEVVELELVNSDAVFAVVPPLALLELLWLRALATRALRSLRPNLIVALRKGPAPGEGPSGA